MNMFAAGDAPLPPPLPSFPIADAQQVAHIDIDINSLQF